MVTNQNDDMKLLADNLWDYFKPMLQDQLEHNIGWFRATVTANPGGGMLTIKRPFDNEFTVKAVASMRSSQVGDNVLVFTFGNNLGTNAVVMGSADAHNIGGGQDVVVDSELSATSTNPVQNAVITNALNGKQDELTLPLSIDNGGTNAADAATARDNLGVNWSNLGAEEGAKYIKFPDGTMIQWGEVGGYVSAKRDNQTVNLSESFLNTDYYVMCTGYYGSDPNSYEMTAIVHNNSKSQFVVHRVNTTNNYLNTMMWLAIGKWK